MEASPVIGVHSWLESIALKDDCELVEKFSGFKVVSVSLLLLVVKHGWEYVWVDDCTGYIIRYTVLLRSWCRMERNDICRIGGGGLDCHSAILAVWQGLGIGLAAVLGALGLTNGRQQALSSEVCHMAANGAD
jgi:hypothetical protein